MPPITETFAKFIEAQDELETEIRKLLANMKKDGQSRKTMQYFNERKQKLSSLWEKIKGNHEKMAQLEMFEHDYYQTDVFARIKTLFSETSKYINEKMAVVEISEEKSSNSKDSLPGQQRPIEAQQLLIKEQKIRLAELTESLSQIHSDLEGEISLPDINNYLEYLKKRFEIVENINVQIQVHEEQFADIYFQNNMFQSMKKQYDTILKKLNNRGSATSFTTTNSNVKLPFLKIPIFTGKYEEWTAFKDIFSKVIHSNQSISNVEKMQYLKTSLKGEANRVIQHFCISEANYEAAWAELNNRYNNKKLISSKLINAILDLPKIRQDSVEDLKNLYSTTKECLEALNVLGVDTQSWGPMIVCILTRKLDSRTAEIFESSVTDPMELQSLDEMLTFIMKRFQALETMAGLPKYNYYSTDNERYVRKQPNCKYCHLNHHLYQCAKFKALSNSQRFYAAKDLKVCLNCLNHENTMKCNSLSKCSICQKNHHTLIHRDFPSTTNSNSKTVTENKQPKPNGSTNKINSHHVANQKNTTVLATAIIKVKTARNSFEYLRALVDPGSQASFITEEASNVLNIPKQKICAEVKGIGDCKTITAKYKVETICKPRVSSNYSLITELLVLPKLTSSVPNEEIKVDINQWNTVLADPAFYRPGPIDILLGAKDYREMVLEGIKKTNDGLVAQNTEFGWIIFGAIPTNVDNKINVVTMTAKTEEQDISKFWELEEIEDESRKLSEQEKCCEGHFAKTVVRGQDGKYTVTVPFKADEDTTLGDSRSRAAARLIQLEKRLAKDVKLNNNYKEFMSEYLHLGHMIKVPKSEEGQGKYYIPHQAVLRESSTTTKLRVVFDASCKSSNGKCLNQIMHAGPRLQQDLIDIILRWRIHAIAFTADVEKMYRQIKISDSDQNYHRILWRFSPSDPISEYKLTTVTYGTTAAPYLAIRTMHQLAKDEKENFPNAAQVATQDFYVDDLLSGADTEQEAIQIQQELIEMFASGNFKLRKWASNNQQLADSIPEDLQDINPIETKQNDAKKTLGIYWAPRDDTIKFKVNVGNNTPITKRTILSDTAKLFDPAGWLAPVVVKAKLLIQELWLQNLSWDEPVSQSVQERWTTFKEQMPTLENIVLTRWINYRKYRKIEIHGFCDSSEKAYGAAVYTKTISETGETKITLLAAKSKVAPIKNKTTLPRLELCAAVLLSKLLNRILTALHPHIENPKTFAWTDSMITLSWIKGDPTKWKTFVANRVSEIQKRLPASCWHHVRTEHNPADAVSRGIDPSKLKDHKIWWKGPAWLQDTMYPDNTNLITDKTTNEEAKRCYTITCLFTAENELCQRFSSFLKMIRVIAYCRRFVTYCRSKSSTTSTGHLTVQELQEAEKRIIKIQQEMDFGVDLKDLRKQSHVHKQSKISILHPFLDNEEILRVGGRLKHSLLRYGEKHPIILSSDSHLAKLIIKEAHQVTLHGGNQETLAYVRRKYWIINAKRSVKSVINNCIKCIRYKAQTSEQLMGHLPVARVTATSAFTHTGIDYAGPVQVRTTKGRGNKSYKGYIAIFICMSTKAIHIEIVSDMTTESFLAALKRFVSRRGTCSHLYSDNGTTFVGANTLLEKEAIKISQTSTVQDEASKRGIQWHFIPPSAPHFGGLWEAGVKSTKFHLKRVIGESTLTYEELTTLTHEIEACLNSRPLCPLTEDINDFNVLTPAHFTIGRELLAPPMVISEDFDQNLTGRWKVIQRMRKDFWRTWHSEYLHQLQQRYKWKFQSKNIKVGDMVILKEDNVSASNWPLARIIKVHPDPDNVTRVVTLKKQGGTTMDRPIHKLILLPVQSEQTSPEVCQKPSIRRPKNSRTAHFLWKASMIAILFLTTIGKSAASSTTSLYQVEYPQPGFFIEHIGHATIERGTFRIEIKFQKSKIKNDTETVQKVIQNMESFCNQTLELAADNIDCSPLIQQLKEKEKELSWIKLGLEISLKKREKRGVLGTLLTSIFGVNDEVYKDISDLDKNQRELIQASHHQTKFMLQALSKFNDTEVKIYQKLNQFQEKLNQGLSAINNMQHWYSSVDHNKLNIHLIATYQIASTFLDELITHYKSLLNMHVNQANLYEFISPAQIENIIITSSKKLPSNIEILSYPILRTDLAHSKQFIHLYGYFTMSEVADFMLLKVTPIPHNIDKESYWSIDVPNDVIAVDYNTQRYFLVTDEELRESTLVSDHRYVCSPSNVRSIENSPNCIIDELYKRTENNTCPVSQKSLKSSIWRQLYSRNSWLFILASMTRIGVTCSGNREDITLNKTGIITISQNCIISTKKMVLTPKRSASFTVLGGFSKPVAVNLTALKAFKRPANTAITSVSVLKPSDDLAILKDEEQEIDQELQEVHWKAITHHTIITSVITILVIIVLISILFYSLKRICQAIRRPPQSRSQPQDLRPAQGPSQRLDEGIELQPLRVDSDQVYAEPRR